MRARESIRHKGLRHRVAVAVLLAAAVAPEAIMAQQQGESAANPEIKALQAEVERAKLEKELAEAQQLAAEAARKELEAGLPKSATKGAEGSLTVGGGGGYYAELLAYKALENSSVSLGETLKADLDDQTVVLTDLVDLDKDDVLWQIIDAKLTDFEGRFDALDKQFPSRTDDKEKVDVTKLELAATALVALPAMLGAAADIAAFFRVNREIAGRTVTIGNRSLLASVAGAIKRKSPRARVIVPNLRMNATNSLVNRLSETQKKRREAVRKREAIRLELAFDPSQKENLTAGLTAKRVELERLTKANASAPQLQKVEGEIEKLSRELTGIANKEAMWARISEQFSAVITAFDSLEATLTSRAAGQALSPLEAISTIDAIRSLSSKKVLVVGLASQGAEMEITKSAWTSGRISYIGGNVLSYFLISDTGEVEAAGTRSSHVADSFKGKDGPKNLAAAVQ
jgi:hypothetical protein